MGVTGDEECRQTGLVVIDMLNPYDHPEADRLAARISEAIGGDSSADELADSARPTANRF